MPAGSDLPRSGPEPDLTAEPATDPDLRGDGVVADASVDPREVVTGESQPIPNGHLLTNRYRLTGRIAAGGMGEVWRGTDELLGRPVAVKLLSDARAADEQFRARFRDEARYAASLSHPGIARVYDYGESAAGQAGDGRPAINGAFLVMELVDGEPLSATLAREGRMSAHVALGIVAQAALALAAAHEAGIVHRDVKPGNLLITSEGQVKITDFGIARAALAAHLTQSGMVMGTAQYVSPEQATARPVTAATDIYSLGVVAYECLAGGPPFSAETPIALALAHVSRPPPPLPDDVPPPAAALVGQMLAKEPSARPASARLVADRARALRDSLRAGDEAGVTGSAEPAGPAAWFAVASPTSAEPGHPGTAPIPPAGPRRPRSRRSATWAVTTGAVGAVAAAGVIALIATNKHPATASTSRPASSTPAHRPHRPRHHAAPESGFSSQPAPVVPAAPRPSTSTRPPPTPTRSATSGPESSPPASSSPPPTTSPPPTGTSSPTPTGPAGPGATGAVAQGPQAANPRTQDR